MLKISKNVILKIVQFSTDYTECVMEATNRVFQPRNCEFEDRFTHTEEFLKIVGNEMVYFNFLEPFGKEALFALELGIDELEGSYDIPEWNLENLSVGEVLLEAWKRASAENVNKGEWKNYTKYLVKRKSLE